MKIWALIKKEMVTGFREVNVMLIFTLMPILIIAILGLTFNNVMESEVIEMDHVAVEYAVEGDEAELTDGFTMLMGELITGEGSSVTKVSDLDGSVEKLKDAKISCAIRIDETNGEITVYKNSLQDTEGSLIEGVLGTYVARYNAITEIVKVNPRAMAEIDTTAEAGDYSRMTSLGERKTFGSMDYYGTAMIVLFVLYAVLPPFYSISNERKIGTGNRMLSSPFKKYEFFMGKFFGGMVLTILQLGVVVVVSTFVFGVNWGNRPILPMMLLLSEIVMATSIGICFGLVIKNEGTAASLVHTLIVLFGFFGGTYIPLSQVEGLAEVGRYFSPIWWIIGGMNNQIYLNDTTMLMQALAICLVAAAVFFGISVLKLSRMEGFEHA